jgi:AcrR family transcriptional regulator
MSPRPRTVSNDDIFLALQRVMSKLGPTRLTLAAVAREAGLSAATLVQRFGSKRGLMLALWAAVVGGTDDCFVGLRGANASPLEAALDGAVMMARGTESVEELANSLAFLQMDVSDPEYHPHMLVLSQRTEAGYQRLLDEAVAAGELVRCDTLRLARALNAIAGGSLISWAVFREGSAESWVRNDLETLIAPYRAARPRQVPARKKPRSRKPGK